MKMKKLFTLMFIAVLLVIVPQVWAQDAGDVGSPECGSAQLAAQNAVASGGPYKNHGQLVSTAATVVSPLDEAGTITDECASCIMNQFARSIPIDQQKPCGIVSPSITTTPDPTTGTVGTTTLNDGATLSGGLNPTGTIAFNLFDVTDPTCSGTPVFTNTVTVSGNGTYNTSSGFLAAKAGTYHWVATYSGDLGNSGVSSICADEAVVVTAPASCLPTSSLSVLIQGTNVSSYVPKGAWSSSATGVSLVQVEGTGITPAVIPTSNVVNSCASNSMTGQTVCTANNTDVYLISGSTLSPTLTSSGSGAIAFSGGSCTNCGVAINSSTNQALIVLSTSGGAGFQFLDLSGTPTFEPAFASPSGEVSEDIVIDPIRNLVLSPTEASNYEIVDVTTTTTPAFFENLITPSADFDSAAEDCSTGIVLASVEELGTPTGKIFIADLTQATFTPGSPGTWSAPSQLQNLPDFATLSFGVTGIAVATGSHIGVVTGEFGGSAFGAIQLPSTSGAGTPAISDWVECNIPNDPSGAPWSMGLDPHTVTAYVSPNTGDAMGLVANTPSPTFLAVVDLTKLLNTAIVPRLPGTNTCDPSTDLVAAGVVSFIPVP
jgi:hypothetical protein